MHAEGAVALVLLADAAGDYVDVGLRLLHRNAGLQPDQDVVVLVAPVFHGIGAQWQRQKDVDLVHGSFRRHHFGIEQEPRLQHARHGEWVPVERDALPYDRGIGVEQALPNPVAENGYGRFTGFVFFRQQQPAKQRLGAEHS